MKLTLYCLSRTNSNSQQQILAFNDKETALSQAKEGEAIMPLHLLINHDGIATQIIK